MNKSVQRVSPVRTRSQEEHASSLNRPLPRWVLYLLGLLAVLAALIVLPNMHALHVYEKYFRGNSPDIQIPFEKLTSQMDETAVRASLAGVSLTCEQERQSGLGDRVCYSALSSANGHPALAMAMFFQKGHLRHVVMQVPWWAHGRMQKALHAQWGKAVRAGTDDTGRTVLRWKLPNGQLEMNDTRYLNPLSWSVLFWTSR
jgi:hypothetical protein